MDDHEDDLFHDNDEKEDGDYDDVAKEGFKASSTLRKLNRARDDKLNSEYEYDENDVDDVLYLDDDDGDDDVDDDDDDATLSNGVLQAS